MKVFAATSLLIAVSIQAQAACETLKPFTSDGCSRFPDGDIFISELWKHCCVEHDVSYWAGGSFDERLQADERLFECVAATGETEIAELMFLGVRVGGGPSYPTPYRWGYGWSKRRGYRPLSEGERACLKEKSV